MIASSRPSSGAAARQSARALVQAREVAQRDGQVRMQLAELRLADRERAPIESLRLLELSARVVRRRQIVERLHELHGLRAERLLANRERAAKIALGLLEIAEGERDLSELGQRDRAQ